MKIRELEFKIKFENIVKNTPHAKRCRHPSWTGEVTPAIEQIWQNTVRISTDKGAGSGFFIRSKHRTVIVTNAHVVDQAAYCCVEYELSGIILQFPSQLIAIDYPHDIAVLEFAFDGTRLATPLELGRTPVPGQPVYVCGHPLGCDTKRVLTGIVSGYEELEIEGLANLSVVIQAPVNEGSSGGPVCDSEGRLVGVIWAINSRIKHGSLQEHELEAADVIRRVLTPTDGFGFALAPQTIADMLDTVSFIRSKVADRLFEKFTPREVSFPRTAFVELQRLCAVVDRPTNMSSIGVFNYSPDEDQLLLGWRGEEQVELDAPKDWLELASSLFANGGHFILHGLDVRIYKSKYKGWIVPVRLRLD